MKTILHERLRRTFSVLLLMASMLIVGIGEAKAVAITLPEERISLDFGAVLVFNSSLKISPA